MLELDDGSCLGESLAICRYFEELSPEPNLFGRGIERATMRDVEPASSSSTSGCRPAWRFAITGFTRTGDPLPRVG